jgi:hypothetical protein
MSKGKPQAKRRAAARIGTRDRLGLAQHERITGEKGNSSEKRGISPSSESSEGPFPKSQFANEKIEAAITAFRRDLPLLLKQRPGQWVAYHGSERVDFSDDDFELFKRCLSSGLKRSEFIVRCILPERTGPMLMGPADIRQPQGGEEET